MNSKTYEQSGKPSFDALLASGFSRVSNRYRIVARVDREDWKEASFGGPCQARTASADFYRRIISEDCIEEVPAGIFRRLPNSHDDKTEFKTRTF